MVVPIIEHNNKWFQLWNRLFGACKQRLKGQESKYDHWDWQISKRLIECALNNVVNSQNIFSRTAQIKTESNPDGIIDDVFAELRCIPYLLSKGFKNIRYNKENNVDFIAEFNGVEWGIEVTYVRGPNFKTQHIYSSRTDAIDKPIYSLDSQKLINRFKSKQQEKEKQVLKHGFNETNAIVFLITDLGETYEPWLSHRLIGKKHPIDFFANSTKIFTVVFGVGTVYEPDKKLFDKFIPFSFQNFTNFF